MASPIAGSKGHDEVVRAWIRPRQSEPDEEILTGEVARTNFSDSV